MNIIEYDISVGTRNMVAAASVVKVLQHFVWHVNVVSSPNPKELCCFFNVLS